MRNAIHSLVPNLSVSPLALPPRALRFERVVTNDDCEAAVTGEGLLLRYLYDTEDKRDAGSTLSAALSGPKRGVHLTPRTKNVWSCAAEESSRGATILRPSR